MFKTIFIAALLTISTIYIIAAYLIIRKQRRAARDAHGPALEKVAPSLFQLFVGFLTDFLDTLGIGSFATTTSLFKLARMMPDELVPGTLNAGHALPTITETCLYIAIVKVDLTTLLLMIVAAVLGAWLGAGIVSRWPRRTIQISMGLALLAVAGLMALRQLNLIAALGSGTSLGLDGYLLWLGILGNFLLGALMTIGIGLYAPCMALVYMLGMQPLAAFPIMMGSCAFLMPIGSLQFIRSKRFSLRAALGLTLGGIPGVFLAWKIVTKMPIEYIVWLVVIVVVYTATKMLHSAWPEGFAALGLRHYHDLPIALGAALGGLIGFLLRPSVPLLGHLPFSLVITRGSQLDFYSTLRLAAERSFIFLLVGVILGAIAGAYSQNIKLRTRSTLD